jgi:hypothetical protein
MSNAKVQMSKIFLNLSLDIHLTFACLREAASAKAGILALVIAFIEVMVCPFGQLLETILQKNPFFLEIGSIPILIHINGFPPDKDSF